jgi:hypothetical protein
MQRRQCQHDSLAGGKLGGECGARLELACSLQEVVVAHVGQRLGQGAFAGLDADVDR